MKRFTDTDKWRDPWFRKLSAGAKLAFLFIVDNCDNAGVWDADMELANFSIGMEIPWEKVRESLGERMEVLKSGKWHLKKFVTFQCGELSEECKPHAAVIRLLNKHGIQRVSKGYPKGIHTLKEKDQDKEKDEDQEGDARGKEKKAGYSIPECFAGVDGFDEALQGWIDSRKQLRKPATDHAVQLMLGKLSQKPGRAIAALNKCILSGWQGFEWAWMDGDNRNGTPAKPAASYYLPGVGMVNAK